MWKGFGRNAEGSQPLKVLFHSGFFARSSEAHVSLALCKEAHAPTLVNLGSKQMPGLAPCPDKTRVLASAQGATQAGREHFGFPWGGEQAACLQEPSAVGRRIK